MEKYRLLDTNKTTKKVECLACGNTIAFPISMKELKCTCDNEIVIQE